jgi:hypothetical protein
MPCLGDDFRLLILGNERKRERERRSRRGEKVILRSMIVFISHHILCRLGEFGQCCQITDLAIRIAVTVNIAIKQ